MELKSNFFVCALLSGIVIAGLTGCGENGDRQETAPVSGVVTLDGKPVPQGSLLFVPATPGPTGQANLKPDGTFIAGTYEVADGLIPGEYTVSITGQMEVDPETTQTALAEDAGKVKAPEQLPAKYGDEKTSSLTASIKPGESHQLTFELKRK